ncbi:unnamed protein product [Urochloa humidicola]
MEAGDDDNFRSIPPSQVKRYASLPPLSLFHNLPLRSALSTAATAEALLHEGMKQGEGGKKKIIDPFAKKDWYP